jgi:lysophospholipase L1-like esterase
VRFLALGDSYTIGEGVAPAERWPEQLAALLRERDIEVEELEIIARTGWTTGELAAAIDAARPSGPYDLVSLLIGVNDQYRGRPLEEYREEFRRLLDRAIDFAGGASARVLVLSIPDWGVSPFAAGRDRGQIAGEIDAFNAVNREAAVAASAPYADVNTLSREAAAEPADFAADGLHPSPGMYRRWAALVLPVVLAGARAASSSGETTAW